MKIKNVIKRCKKRRQIILIELNGEKWLGDGASLWLMPSFLDCSEEGIFGTFDFTEAERSKVAYFPKEESHIDIYSEDECDTEILDISIRDAKGNLIRPIVSETGILYIYESYFEIFSDKPYNLKIKYTNGKLPAIAVYEGIILIGIIMPYDAASKDLCDTLDILLKNMKHELYSEAE